MSISHRLVEAEEKLESLKQEIESIKAWAMDIAEDNRKLRAELFTLSALRPEEKTGEGTEANPSTASGHANLERLYNEQFHVCPYNFGQRRTGGCLFCVSFLEHTK